MISQMISWINHFMYGKLLILILLAGGLYFTVRSRFVQFRLIRRAFASLMEKPADGDGNVEVTWKQLSTATGYYVYRK